MAIPLQPKITDRNPAQTLRRLEANSLGWPLIPCEGKSRLPKGWPRLKNDAPAIEAWNNPKSGMRPFAGTGTRIEKLMCVLDIDVSSAAPSQGILRRLSERFPNVIAHALCRSSGTRKVALFFLLDRPIGMRRTARYGTGECVEVFGSLVVRYFAIDGPHSEPGRFYTWKGGAPWTVRLADLPTFNADDIGELIDICDDELAKHLPRILNSEKGEAAAETIYDLEPGQLFISTEGEEIELVELEDSLGPESERRGLLSWDEWRASSRKDHCKALLDGRGHLLIVDFQDGIKHRWKTDQPNDQAQITPELAQAIGDMRAAQTAPEPGTAPAAPQEPPMPAPEDGFRMQLAWLLESFAQADAGLVVRLYSTSGMCTQTVKAFNDRYAMFNEPRPAPLVGLNYATKIWMIHQARLSVTSYDMRPDKAFPLYVDEGHSCKNTYRQEQHTGDGEVETALAFLQHLLPLDLAYFLDWLAHKWQRPWIPGHALIMVAAADEGEEQSGTGRGTLFKILERLFGQRYVRHLDFNILTGQSAQGVYTDWMADSLLVCVDESREGTGRFGERRSAYEHLKARCDPAPRWMTVHGKNQPPRNSMICCSYIIATNHADALMLPASDRRFAVLANGDKLSLDDAARIYAWMDVPGNIAALARYLGARDVSAFQPMGWPPQTMARDRMMVLGESELDGLVREALLAMPGLAFTLRQLKVHVYNLAGDSDVLQSGAVDAQLAQIIRRRMRGLAMPGVRPRRERRVRTQGENQARVYVRSASDERKCDMMGHDALHAEVAKNGLRATDQG